MAQVRGTTVSAKTYTTGETDVLSFGCSHNIRSGTVFYLYATTAGSAKVYYKDPSGSYRLLSTTSTSATDLTVISFTFPISECKLTYTGTSSGGTINAEGRGY